MSETPSTRPGLVRGLGPMMATAVVVGTVIGSGIFKKPASVAEHLPGFWMMIAVWVAGGLLAFLGGLAVAELGVLFPQTGGNYVFLREAFGPLFGFLWGWVETLVIKAAAMAALATIFTESFHDVLVQTTGSNLTYWQQKTLAASIIVVLALVNIRGVRWGGGLQLAVTLVKIGTLLGITVLPWVLLALGQDVPKPVPTEYVSLVSGASAGNFPAWPIGALGEVHAATVEPTLAHFLTALLGVLFAYHGWMNVTQVAGEIRQPQRNIPLALLGGNLIVIFVYLGANLAYHHVLPAWEMSFMKSTPVATVFSVRLLGDVGGVVTSAAIMVSVFGALNGNLLAGPRLIFAMGEDGLVPRALAEVHPRYHTPAWAIVVLAGWSALMILIVAALTWFGALSPGKNHFDILTDFAMFGAVIFETLGVATIFVFRWKLPNAPRAYRCWGYPVVPALYLILPALVIGNMFVNQKIEALTGTGFVALGAVVYFVLVKRNYQSPIASVLNQKFVS